MGFPSGNWLLLVSISLALLFVTLSSARLSVEATRGLINNICSATHNPSLCEQVLTSDPRSSNADVRGLCQISIDSAQASAKSTYSLIASLLKQTTDPILDERYKSCSENYDDAISNIGEARKSLSSGDYGGVNIKASAAETDSDTCGDNFATPPAQPPQLAQANQKFQDLCSIVLVISNRLSQPN